MVNCKVVVGMRPMVWGKDICDDRNGLYGKKIDLPIEPFIGLKIDGIANFMPSADYVFSGREHMVILGKNEDVSKLLSMIK